MQVFIIGSPLETAMALDPLRLNKQLLETQQILDALNGKKAWSRHPAVLQYKGHEKWLRGYARVLESFVLGYTQLADFLDFKAKQDTPEWHCEVYYNQMKRRLYTKNPEHYKQWEYLGRSDENWYWSPTENKFIKYVNGKRI